MPELTISHSSYEECADELITFRNANRDTNRDAGYLAWRYEMRPADAGAFIIWARDAKGRAVGSMSVIPHLYYSNGVKRLAGVLGDISVSEKWRGKGVAGKMLSAMPEAGFMERLNFCVVLPNEPAAKPLEKSGWKEIARLERYVKILDSRDFLSRKLGSRALSAVIAPAVNLFLRAASCDSYSCKKREYETATLDAPDERFDALWSEVKKENRLIGARSRDYLAWRFSSHPLTDYKFFCVLAGGKLPAYAVYHLSAGVCHIDDLLALSEKEAERLLSSFIRHIKKRGGINEINLRIHQKMFGRHLFRKFGFRKRADHLKFMVYAIKNEELESLTGQDCYLTGYDKDV